MEKAGLTDLLVAHDSGVVAHLCDRMAVMQHRRAVKAGFRNPGFHQQP
ncbi:hypothetical protein [Azohydromonas lata]|uniref:Uncharacterized protein n=1 Tax=Azohydromonas lata TaxID=45677 RepID=A0ABU5ILD2_9BURK|nr:hypothetical protein [Azohydromonas lata]MDZ5459711.1 hypothetical protein [Azohydromonas lata]